MIITPVKTKIVEVNDNLVELITSHIPKLIDGDILAVTSKIVAYCEGRWVAGTGSALKAKLIRQESDWHMRTRYTSLTLKDGSVLAAAGIDESNAQGGFVLLPLDSYKSAAELRVELMRHYNITRLGVVITDSRLMPLRAGVVAVALGYAGFKGIREYRGTADLDGRIMHMSRTDVADSLATAAVLLMGEGAERQPLAIMQHAPVEWCETVDRNELYIDPREDMYAPLWRAASKWGKFVGRPRVRSPKWKK